MDKGKNQTISCSAGNCSSRKNAGSEVTMHRFPREPAKCKEWIKRAGNSKLYSIPIENLWKSEYLCQHHFSSNQYISLVPMILIPDALPSIFPSDGSNSNFPASAGMPSSCPTSVIPEPSTSDSLPILSTVDANQHLYLSTGTTVETSSSCPSTVPSHSLPILSADSVPPLVTTPPLVSIKNPSLENKAPNQSVRPSSFIPSVPGPSSSTAATLSSNASGKGKTKCVLKRRGPKPSLLRVAGLRRCDVTPRKWSQFSKYRMMGRCSSYLRRKSLAIDLINKIDYQFRLVVQSQLEIFQRKPKNKRQTLMEKLSFIFFKENPDTSMRSEHDLLTKETLLSVLSALSLNTGINPVVIKHLTFCASNMLDHDKYCLLLFDEMSIEPLLWYNMKADYIEGFEDHGSKGRTNGIATEALVFMVRGLQKKWKHPVAFYFSHDSTPGLILADLIKEVLDALQSTGLKVVGTVCDMGSNNILALRTLGYSNDRPFFLFNGQNIFTIHNPPDLLNCTRNMFLEHPVKGNVMVNGKMFTGIGRWSHVKNLFHFMKKKEKEMVPAGKMFENLTEDHFSPTMEQKKDVRFAAEVFSEEIAQPMLLFRALGKLPFETCVTTAFLYFVNALFTSVNGSISDGECHRFPKTRIRVGSPHKVFWASALKEIKDWVFLEDEDSGRPVRSESQDGWVITIRAVKLLWRELKEDGFKFLEPSRLNQNPLETFFSSLRLHDGVDKDPTMQQFTSAFKKSVIRDILCSE